MYGLGTVYLVGPLFIFGWPLKDNNVVNGELG
jgi:hypothetical protein